MFTMLSRLFISAHLALIMRCASIAYTSNCDCVKQYAKATHSAAESFKYKHRLEAYESRSLLLCLQSSCLCPLSKALHITDTLFDFLKHDTSSSLIFENYTVVNKSQLTMSGCQAYDNQLIRLTLISSIPLLLWKSISSSNSINNEFLLLSMVALHCLIIINLVLFFSFLFDYEYVSPILRLYEHQYAISSS